MSRCEWNPTFKVAALDPPAPTDCPNEATIVLGARGVWHVCDTCAQDEKFKLFTKRTPMRTTVSASGDGK